MAATDGFPFERIDAARRYLYTVKPWWQRFGNRLKLVPVFQAPGLDEPYGAFSSTDLGMRLYMDRAFSLRAPLHEIAGQIEHEYWHHANDTWGRLRWLDEDEWARYFTICVDLEINSNIAFEAQAMTMDTVRALCNRSSLFTSEDLARWDVQAPPTLPSFAWTPEALGVPPRLSAEEYYQLLKKADEDRDNEDQEEEEEEEPLESSEEDSEEGEDSSSDEAGDDEAPSDSSSEGDPGTEDSEQGSTSSENSTEDSEEAEGDSSQSEDSASEDEPAEGSDQESQSQESGEGDTDDQGEGQESGSESSEEADGDSGSEDRPQQGEQQGEANQQPQSPSPGQPSEGGSSAADASSADSALTSQQRQESVELGRRFEEMLSDPMRQMAASELSNPDDPLMQQHWMPDEEENEEAADASALSAALDDLAQDVDEASHEEWGKGVLSPRLTQWADEIMAVKRISWESRFLRMFNAAVSSVKLRGQSDLSYSVPNPNQSRRGPILMGLNDYAPEIAILQDISGSMLTNGAMKHSQEVFTQLTSSVLGRYQSAVTWLSADTQLVDVGRTTRWTADMEGRLSYGWGGTNFGDILGDLMGGQLRWKGKKIKRPDLVVVCTDCIFTWPEDRPSYAKKLLVVCVGEARENYGADPLDYLPKWLKPSEVVFTSPSLSLAG